MDVAITRGKVAAVEHQISEESKEALDARDWWWPRASSTSTRTSHREIVDQDRPYSHCLLKGTTTAVDAGSTGELNFQGFKRYVIDQSRRGTLALLNIESLGMIEFADVKPGNTTQEWPSLLTSSDEKFREDVHQRKGDGADHKQTERRSFGISWAHHA